MTVLTRNQQLVGVVVLQVILALLTTSPVSRAEDVLPLTLEYSIEPEAYENAVRVASVGEMLYPRITVDWTPTSPFYGTVYVMGLDGPSCASLVVVRSLDRGRTFDSPRSSDLCLPGLSLDVAVGRDGSVYAATWGPNVLRSDDGGLTWEIAAALDNSTAPTSLSADLATGAVYAAWNPVDRLQQFSPGPILVASSGDGARTWTSPRDVLSGAAEGARPQIAAFDDAVVVGFVSPGPSEPFVASVASSDGGTMWTSVEPLSQPATCLSWIAPSLAASRSGVFAASWYAEMGNVTQPSGCWDTWGASTEVFASVSQDAGQTFSAPIYAGGPPGWVAPSFGDALAFDDASRLYVAWHSIEPGWSSASVYVANSLNKGGGFEQASFATRLREAGGNATAQENLAAGPNGTVFLVWVAFESLVGPGNLSDPDTGIFVRSVAGEALGEVVIEPEFAAQTPIDVELRSPETSDARIRVPWNGSELTVSELPPNLYDVWVHAGNASSLAGTLPIKAWSLTAFTILIGEGSAQPEVPWVAIALGVAFVLAVVAAVLIGVRRSRRRR